MTAIIPVAGAGTRLRPFTYTQPKPLIPVAGKPILSYIVDQLLGLGVEEFVFVIGYLGDKVRDYIAEAYPALGARFVEQAERRGSGHAVWLAREAIGAGVEEVVVVFGDTLIDGDLAGIVACEHTCLAVKPVDDPRRFGVIEFDAAGMVARMVEKPRMPKSNEAMVGFYKVADYPALHDTLGRLLDAHGDATAAGPSSGAGGGAATPEITLTDGLMALLDAGHRMHAERVDRWYDCGDADVLLATNRAFLDERGYGDVETPAFDGTIVIHPVSIGRGCTIEHAIIGPHVSIGDFATVRRSIVSDSIVGRYARLDSVRLEASVVGNDTSLTGRRQSINIGDNTELKLG